MGLGKRIIASFLSIVMIVTSLQFSSCTVNTEEIHMEMMYSATETNDSQDDVFVDDNEGSEIEDSMTSLDISRSDNNITSR
ncbi:MAG: hypothetical protein NC489_31315 [Ruminococcus flavefaciens]|nr:hypothetical protein [Ruminococcus flavefaciens]